MCYDVYYTILGLGLFQSAQLQGLHDELADERRIGRWPDHGHIARRVGPRNCFGTKVGRRLPLVGRYIHYMYSLFAVETSFGYRSSRMALRTSQGAPTSGR